MHNDYNMDQMTLSIRTDYIPNEKNTAIQINELVESLDFNDPYVFGRPRNYDLRALLKLILFAYSRGVVSCRRIEELGIESLPARWLTQESEPSYRTICRFRTSESLTQLIDLSLNCLVDRLKKANLIDDVSFIDGTKILADANKYSFVWKKNTIRFDNMNRENIVSILAELKDAKLSRRIPSESDLSLEMVDDIVTRLEVKLEDLNRKIDQEPKLSPNPNKQQRRFLKSKKHKLTVRRNKMLEHQSQMKIYGERNSYSKTDHDATFMRVKEDPMLNGQLKPAYNLQIATSNQFITAYDVFQNPTDTRTLIPFVKSSLRNLGRYIVADAGYGSESNYRFFEDELPDRTPLIPYGTMLRENSRKWKSDDRKVMNWDYHADDDFYIDPHGVRFSFIAFRRRNDKYGFTREFKQYQANQFDDNHNLVPEALTKGGNLRKISVNGEWEYFKARQRKLLSDPKTGKIYARRKIDVESVFGHMKAYLRFNRLSVRGIDKVKKELGIMILATNVRKLMARTIHFGKNIQKQRANPKITFEIRIDSLILGTYVTAPCCGLKTNFPRLVGGDFLKKDTPGMLQC